MLPASADHARPSACSPHQPCSMIVSPEKSSRSGSSSTTSSKVRTVEKPRSAPPPSRSTITYSFFLEIAREDLEGHVVVMTAEELEHLPPQLALPRRDGD